MRLTPETRQFIRRTLCEQFGQRATILLFGSRVDDNARGGDIDLYVEPEFDSPEAIVDARLKALAQLHERLGEQKIDLVIHRRNGPEQPIHRIARDTGVAL